MPFSVFIFYGFLRSFYEGVLFTKWPMANISFIFQMSYSRQYSWWVFLSGFFKYLVICFLTNWRLCLWLRPDLGHGCFRSPSPTLFFSCDKWVRMKFLSFHTVLLHIILFLMRATLMKGLSSITEITSIWELAFYQCYLGIGR